MNILQRFKSVAANTHNSARGVKQDLLFDIADFVQDMIKQHGLTQRDFAKRIGMKESQLSRILNTEANLTVETIARIFWAFGRRPHLNVRQHEVEADSLIAGSVITFPAMFSTTDTNQEFHEETASAEIKEEYEVTHG